MRSGANYIESMRDGRDVWYRGERVDDITRHPVLGRCVQNRAREYDLHADPRSHDLLAYQTPEGEHRCIGWQTPRNSDDLVNHRRALETLLSEANSGVGDLLHAFGVGGTGPTIVLAALARGEWHDRIEPRFANNISAFYERCAREDLSLCVGSNDAKGDRSKAPFEQDDLDMYTRVVEEREDGIVIRGVKKVCTSLPYSDEVLISTNFRLQSQIGQPEARARMADRYTFLCAVPLNARGLTVICRPSDVSLDDDPGDHPLSWYDEIDGMAVLNDVFIPWERVLIYKDIDFFLGWLNHGFAQLCDFDLCISTASRMELLVGAGSLAVKTNGTASTQPSQVMLARLLAPLEAMRLFIETAATHPDFDDHKGIALPSALYCHLGMNQIFEHLGEMMGTVADVMGGTTVTSQSIQDLVHPEIGRLLNKFFTRPAFEGKDVIRLGRLIQDLTCSAYAMREQMYVRLCLGDVSHKRLVLAQAMNFAPLEQKVRNILTATAEPRIVA